MSIFKREKVEPDKETAFLDTVVSMTTDDSNTYIGARSLRNSDVYTAVKVIASDLASNPIEYTDKRLTKLLNKAPNDKMNAWSFKFALAVNMLLNGNSFARIYRNPSGQVSSLEFINNSRMTVKKDDTDDSLSYYVTDGDGRNSVELKPTEVLHFKSFTSDGLIGTSALYSLADEINIQNTGNKLLRSLFNRSVQGTGILKVGKSNLDAKSKNAIREKFEEANTGDNALRTIILDEDMEYSTLEVNSDVLKFVNSNSWTTQQVAKAFGIPSERLGVENDHTSSTQNNLLYLQNTLVYYFQTFTSELDMKLSSGDNMFTFNTDKLFSADYATVQDLAIKGLQGGLITINEGREKIGLEPVPNGDKLLTSLNYTTLDNLENYQNKNESESTE